MALTIETQSAQNAPVATNDIEPGLVELTTTAETNSARNAPELVRTTTIAPAVPVQVPPTNDIVPRPEALTTTNETPDARNTTKPARTEETLFMTPSGPAAAFPTWPVNVTTAGTNLATRNETPSARGSTQPERTSSPAPAAPARVHPTNDTALAQVNPSTSNYAPSARGPFEPEHTSFPASAAPIETHPTNTTMVQEDAAVSVRAPGKRDAIEPTCTRGMPTAPLSKQPSFSDDTDTARTTTNETFPDKGIECATEEATSTTPKIVGPNGRGELRPFSHNSFASEGNHGEGEQGVETNLSDQPRHFTTTPCHRRLNERTNGSRTVRNAHLEQNNALNAPNSATFTERISPPDETHANVPTRIKPARSYTDSIADGSDVTDATP
ncbi:uncharacterized protein LOC144164092 [Haemaphysalis longicornis]